MELNLAQLDISALTFQIYMNSLKKIGSQHVKVCLRLCREVQTYLANRPRVTQAMLTEHVQKPLQPFQELYPQSL